MLYNIKDFTKELNIYNTVEFRKLENYDNYFIYEDGRVFSLISNKYLKFSNKTGYSKVGILNNDNKQKTHFVHRLVYQAFKGKIPEKYQVDHINGIRDDNRLINLRLLTPKENSQNKHHLEQYKEMDKIKYIKENGKERYKKRKEYYKEYAEKNKEEINKRRREYYNKNKEKMQEYAQIYREQHREKLLINKRKYNEENKEEIRQYRKEYYEKHREEINRKRREKYRLNKMNKI